MVGAACHWYFDIHVGAGYQRGQYRAPGGEQGF
jgi:hypothetical protein